MTLHRNNSNETQQIFFTFFDNGFDIEKKSNDLFSFLQFFDFTKLFILKLTETVTRSIYESKV